MKNKKTNEIKEEIEVLDLSNDSPVENTLETRKDNKLLIIIIVVIIAFVLLLPYLTSLFDKNSNQNYAGTVDNNSKTNLVNGFIQIDKTDGNMTLEDIKFYNFLKRSNNIITYNYKSGEPKRNVKSLGLYVELYNKNENIIYREEFYPSDKIEKGPVLSTTISLNPIIYQEAYYAKVVKITNENLDITSSLICKKEFTDEVYKGVYTTKFNFGLDALLTYEVTKQITVEKPSEPAEGTESTYEKYNDLFLKEEADIKNTNTSTITREDNHISYIIDLRNLELKDSNYEVLYKIGTVERTVKLIEEANGWSCQNE